jgi:hypothetical protein
MDAMLIKKLRDAGFPQKSPNSRSNEIIPNPFRTGSGEDYALLVGEEYVPSKADLIAALGEEYNGVWDGKYWPNGLEIAIFIARGKTAIEIGSTEEDALGRLWLAANSQK